MIIIRSQNGERLIRTKHIEYEHEFDFDKVNGVTKEEHIISGGNFRVGGYASRERCIEIIDEIQTFAGRIFRDQLTPTGTACDICPIYQMPEE